MARHLTPIAALVLALAAAPSLALGPTAPFTPPARTAATGDATPSADAPVADTGGLTGLRLRNHPMALIDGQWLRIGDTVRGARISAIRADGAWLRHADGRNELLPWNGEAERTVRAPSRPPAPAPISLRTRP